MDKYFIDANTLLIDSFQLAEKVFRSGFEPNFIVGVWRGGAPIGIAVQEYFKYVGVHTDHIAIRTTSYNGINDQRTHVDVHGLEYLTQNIEPSQRLLIVDDVFDSGRSVEAILKKLHVELGSRMPTAIKIACPWYKPKRNATNIEPDFYLHTTEQWLVFPHEICGLTLDEILKGKNAQIHALLKARQP